MRIKNLFCKCVLAAARKKNKKNRVRGHYERTIKTIECTSHEYKYIAIANYRRKQPNADELILIPSSKGQ